VIDVVLHSAFRVIPIDWATAIACWLGVFAGRYRFRAGYARARSNYLRLARGGPSEQQADVAMTRLWGHFGRVMAEFSTLDRLWAAGRIRVVGGGHLAAARAVGKPILIMGLHLGNWEVIGPALIAMGFSVSAIYQPPRSRFEEAIAVASRQRYGAVLLRAGVAAARKAYRVLVDNGGMLLFFIDEEQRGEINAPLFGRPLRPRANLANAVRLAWASGAAAIPAYADGSEGPVSWSIFSRRSTSCLPSRTSPKQCLKTFGTWTD
jgi:Kdo2-lipid IVA lauroyltransferase/acyltransferase